MAGYRPNEARMCTPGRRLACCCCYDAKRLGRTRWRRGLAGSAALGAWSSRSAAAACWLTRRGSGPGDLAMHTEAKASMERQGGVRAAGGCCRGSCRRASLVAIWRCCGLARQPGGVGLLEAMDGWMNKVTGTREHGLIHGFVQLAGSGEKRR
jgi:hypothetical protein